MALGPVGRRNVADDVQFLQLAFRGGVIGIVMGAVVGWRLGHAIIGGVAGGMILGGAVVLIHRILAGTAAAAIQAAIMSDSRGGTGVPYSHIETLEAKGDIAGALAAWEEVIAASPDAIAARVNAADLHAKAGKNPVRAAELFRAVKAHAKAPEETHRYAAQRLIDLYLGPLNDQGKALVELRKVADRWPDTPEGRGAKRAIADIKKGNP